MAEKKVRQFKDDPVLVSFSIERKTRERLKKIAKKLKTSSTEVIEKLVNDYRLTKPRKKK